MKQYPISESTLKNFIVDKNEMRQQTGNYHVSSGGNNRDCMLILKDFLQLYCILAKSLFSVENTHT